MALSLSLSLSHTHTHTHGQIGAAWLMASGVREEPQQLRIAMGGGPMQAEALGPGPAPGPPVPDVGLALLQRGLLIETQVCAATIEPHGV